MRGGRSVGKKNSSCESNNIGGGLGHVVGSEDTRTRDSRRENALGCDIENKQLLQAQWVVGPVGIMRCNSCGIGSGASLMKGRVRVSQFVNESEGDGLWGRDGITLRRFSGGERVRSGHG